MILSEIDLLNVLMKKPNKAMIEFGKTQRKKARMHMYGVNMSEYLTQIEGFEKPWLREVRLKYVQSNKDLFARISKPINKIFTARGGSTYYNLNPQNNEKAAKMDSSILENMSIKKWMDTYWKMHLLDDPMGLIFMEIDEDRNIYPTYKCIIDIEDYKIDEGKIEYVIFKMELDDKRKLGLEDKAQVFRVVDDAFDKIVILDNEKIIEVQSQTYPNYFGFVPAMTNSPFINPDGQGFISPLYWVFDLADQFLLKVSIRLTHEFRHGFPKYYEYADDCITCKGTGKRQGKNCDECKGTGKKIMLNVSDAKLLEYPSKDSPGLKGAPGGYIEPSEVFYNIISRSLQDLEERINQTLWGSKSGQKLKSGMGLSAAPNGTVTATEVMDNRQPEIDCLNVFSDAAEIRDKFITDCAVMVYLKVPDYIKSGGCSKNYGRRFLIEEADALLERYVAARKEGVSPGILFGLYEQYLEAKYQSDGVSLSLHKKLLKIEPFMHYTLEQMKLNGFSPEDLKRKMFYGEWLSSVNNNSLILASVNNLQQQFVTYLEGKPNVVIEPQVKKPVL